MFVRAVQLLTQRNDGTIVVRASHPDICADYTPRLSSAAIWPQAYLTATAPPNPLSIDEQAISLSCCGALPYLMHTSR